MSKATLQEVFASIEGEYAYQDMRGQRDGTTSRTGDHNGHSAEEWLIYMDSYFREAKDVAARSWGNPEEVNRKIGDVTRKVVALGCRLLQTTGAPQREGFERTVPVQPQAE